MVVIVCVTSHSLLDNGSLQGRIRDRGSSGWSRSARTLHKVYVFDFFDFKEDI